MIEYPDKRVQRSKTALKQTFLQFLQNKSLDQITITEIVKEANYNRGTFYAHFDSKEVLLAEIVDDVLKEMVRQIRKPYLSLTTINLEEMNVEEITLFSYFKENEMLFKTLLSNHIQIDFRHKIAKAIEELFIAEYEYELEESHLDLKLLYIYRSHGIAGIIIRWIEDGFQESPEYMSEQIVALMVTSTKVFHIK